MSTQIKRDGTTSLDYEEKFIFRKDISSHKLVTMDKQRPKNCFFVSKMFTIFFVCECVQSKQCVFEYRLLVLNLLLYLSQTISFVFEKSCEK